MKTDLSTGIVSTISQKCRRCYSCVRDCPAKAIRVVHGQAFVLSDRCISCGHCVKVCSQEAKSVESDVEKTIQELLKSKNVAAIVAPSFPVSFPDNYKKFPAALRKIGFGIVAETAFGADLVSKKYQEIFENNHNSVVISSPCPAVINFIEKFHHELIPNLAPVVSPMIAMGRYMKENYGPDLKVVFIGPCIAKKSEYAKSEVSDAVDAVLTFKEIKEILKIFDVKLESLENSSFDPPYANLGKTYPLAGGLLKTSEISNDLLAKEVIVVEGMKNVEEIFDELKNNRINARFIDILFCEGCINGPAIDSELNRFAKREKIIEYVDSTIQHVDKNVWRSDLYNSRELKLSRTFRNRNQRRPMPPDDKIKEILSSSHKYTKQDELNCGACGYPTCREYAIAIAKDLAEPEMCLPFLIEKLENAYLELKETQDQLQSAEKLASIGQLAAGIAHEINNPLGTIMLYTSMIKRELEKCDKSEQSIEDLRLVIEEANRCKSIVANLLNFARHGKLKIAKIDIVGLIHEVLRIIKVRQDSESVVFNFNENKSIYIDGDQDQLKQVLINIISNAVESMEEIQVKIITIIVSSSKENCSIEVKDTGTGISEENQKKLFTPFFTTKKMGKGTGLGLAISYGIVKMHRGDITVKSEPGFGSTFGLRLPVTQSQHIQILQEL
ncbi:MAG: GHKL domain-containing protein [Ignavibacteriales bacterium]|nr:GHKL domain-containing protein [Ignavibacteriales bacterium]